MKKHLTSRLAVCAFLLVGVSVALASPAAAGPRVGTGSQVAAAGGLDWIRCNWGFRVVGGITASSAYCYFSTTAVSGEPGGSYGAAAFRAAAGTTTGSFWGPDKIYSGDNGGGSNFLSCAGGLTGKKWEIGPMVASSGLNIPAGAALWSAGNGSSIPAGCEGSGWATGSYAGARGLTTVSCTTIAAWMSSNQVGVCRGNYMGMVTGAYTLAEKGFDGLDWFPGSSGYVEYVDWCDALEVTFAGPTGTTVPAGSLVRFTLDNPAEATYPAEIGPDIELRYRFDADDTFKLFPASFNRMGGPWLVDLPVGLYPRTLSAGFEISCKVASSDTTYYYDVAGLQTEAPRVSRPCTNTVWQWPKFPLAAGVPSRFAFTVSAGSYLTGVEGIAIVDRSDPVNPVQTEITAFEDSTGAPRAVSGLYYVDETHGLVSFLYTPTKSLTADETILVCVDTVGGRNFFPGSVGALIGTKLPPGSTQTYLDRLDECFDALPGMSLTSPTSWVKGILGGLLCIGQLLAVPNEQFFESLRVADADAVWSETSVFYPVSLVTSVASSAVSMVVVTDAEVNAGACGFRLPFQKINSTGNGLAGSETTIIGMSGAAVGFNTCATADDRTVVKAVRYLGLMGAILAFLTWAYRYVQLLRKGREAYMADTSWQARSRI